jgi:hypothetical protein
MLRCSHCGQYYVPGFLDCQCRAIWHTGHPVVLRPTSANLTAAPQPDRTLTATTTGPAQTSSQPPVRLIRNRQIRF